MMWRTLTVALIRMINQYNKMYPLKTHRQRHWDAAVTGLYLRHSSMSLKIWRLKQQIELWNFEMLWLTIWVKMMFHPWQV